MKSIKRYPNIAAAWRQNSRILALTGFYQVKLCGISFHWQGGLPEYNPVSILGRSVRGNNMDNIQNSALWEFLREASREMETTMDPLERKRTGSYYTDLELTDVMMGELVSHLKKGSRKLWDYRFLEPCVGTGNFVFSYLKAVKKEGVTSKKARHLLENLYVADCNLRALTVYRESLNKLVSVYWDFALPDDYFIRHMGSGLLADVMAPERGYIKLEDAFSDEMAGEGFDLVATNPPFKNLKAERGHYGKSEEYEFDKEIYASISRMAKETFQYSADGVLNLYKLFTEEIIERYANAHAYVSLLLPSSILSDKTCQKLRTHMLKDTSLLSIKGIPENSHWIDAQQALSAVLLQKGSATKTVQMVKNYYSDPQNTVSIDAKDILNQHTGNAIIAVSKEEYPILRRLRQFPVVKDLDFIINLRGELDLTANKKSITSNDTGYPLLRGRNIGYYHLLAPQEPEFVSAEFVKTARKGSHIGQERIICQQIANIHKERRVTFALAPKNHVLGNSCNYILVKENPYGIDQYTLLGLFNTKLINWLFKLTSSNNHVNNYEIDSFPVPVGASQLQEISDLARQYLTCKKAELLDEMETLARKAYEIQPDEEKRADDRQQWINQYWDGIRYILPAFSLEDARQVLEETASISDYCGGLDHVSLQAAEGITKKYKGLYCGRILNHTTFKLSELDLEMIRSVPPGGNWKNIPKETVEKSKRLKRITQTGGRTTLYGRLDYNRPSYTITTYFNRPGNGTYVHPVHQRVLSVREAARLQAFPDDYYFFGNRTQNLKQVGNAVPTLLAYQIGKKVKEQTGCQKSIDLFCGAGGLTTGLKAAGIHSLLSNDIEESACITLKINNPEIPVLCGDITREETKAAIEKAAKEGGADLICGGPPCQGFSMAGFRSATDPRNQLFRDFADVVKRVNPKVIVFENVEGLLSYQKGKTYEELLELFAGLGYDTEGRSLMASDYAVPQKRKRVIIISVRRDLQISPDRLFPIPITESEKSQVTVREAIGDLETVACSELAQYSESGESDLQRFFKGKLTYEEYINSKTLTD